MAGTGDGAGGWGAREWDRANIEQYNFRFPVFSSSFKEKVLVTFPL